MSDNRIETLAEFSIPRRGTTETTLDVDASEDSVSLFVSTQIGSIEVVLLPEDVEDLRADLADAAEALDPEAVAARREWIESSREQGVQLATDGVDR